MGRPQLPPRRCEVVGCERVERRLVRDMCGMHYARWRIHGSTEPRDSRSFSLEQRLWLRTVVDRAGCRLWMGNRNKWGYGAISDKGQARSVHRVSYSLFVGPIPEGHEVDHLCRVRNCWTPDHLEAVTKVEHGRRSQNATKTHCPEGHEYGGVNLYEYKGGRYCRKCRVIKNTRYKKRLRALGIKVR